MAPYTRPWSLKEKQSDFPCREVTPCNMAIEAGGKNGIIVPDAITEEYVKERAKRPYTLYATDSDAHFTEIRDYDCSSIPLTVACPHLPSNTKPATELSHITIDQVVVGSCTNGRIEDLREAAQILTGRKVNPNVRMIIFPATQQIYKQAMREGLLDIFIDAEAVVSTPTCGPCLGGHMGVPCQRRKGRWRLPIETLSAGWAIRRAKSISRTPLLPLQQQC